VKPVFAALFFLSSIASAQFRAPGGVTFVNPGGFGSVSHPGTGLPLAGSQSFGSVNHPGTGLPVAGSFGFNQSFPARLGATVAGRPLPTRNRNGRSAFISAYPVFVGGYGSGFIGDGYGASPDAAAQPNVTIVNQPAPTPTVIINQNFGPPQEPDTSQAMHVYQPQASARTEEPSPAQNTAYLIAFKDHSVYSAVAYWVEDKTLHYVTAQNKHNQASLDLIDLDFTKKLNQDRNVPFQVH
jgi:hypothetical protein